MGPSFWVVVKYWPFNADWLSCLFWRCRSTQGDSVEISIAKVIKTWWNVQRAPGEKVTHTYTNTHIDGKIYGQRTSHSFKTSGQKYKCQKRPLLKSKVGTDFNEEQRREDKNRRQRTNGKSTNDNLIEHSWKSRLCNKSPWAQTQTQFYTHNTCVSNLEFPQFLLSWRQTAELIDTVSAGVRPAGGATDNMLLFSNNNKSILVNLWFF